VRSPKKFNIHLCQKVPFVLVCFQASSAPRPENSDSDEKDALFGLGTQISIIYSSHSVLESPYLGGTFAICNWKMKHFFK
jgi:hypothetical protein